VLGRPGFGQARDLARRLDADGWHVFQNGASVVHVATGASRSTALPPEGAAALVARARATDRVLEVYTDDAYAVEPTTPAGEEHARRHAALLGVPYAPVGYDALGAPPVRAQWLTTAPRRPRSSRSRTPASPWPRPRRRSCPTRSSEHHGRGRGQGRRRARGRRGVRRPARAAS
jgi:hypothetical protein